LEFTRLFLSVIAVFDILDTREFISAGADALLAMGAV
jgi:hypothetical protein